MSGRGPAAGVVVLLTLLVGCTGAIDDPTGTVPPAPSPTTASTSETPTENEAETESAAPTTSAAAGAPTMPAEAQQQTPEGAAAFVQHWYAVLEYSWSVMHSAPIRALGECLTCIQFADTIDGVASRGNVLDGGSATVTSVQPNAVADGRSSAVVLFSAEEQREISPTGDVVDVVGASVQDLQYFFDLTWTQNAWSVTSIRVIR